MTASASAPTLPEQFPVQHRGCHVILREPHLGHGAEHDQADSGPLGKQDGAQREGRELRQEQLAALDRVGDQEVNGASGIGACPVVGHGMPNSNRMVDVFPAPFEPRQPGCAAAALNAVLRGPR